MTRKSGLYPEMPLSAPLLLRSEHCSIALRRDISRQKQRRVSHKNRALVHEFARLGGALSVRRVVVVESFACA